MQQQIVVPTSDCQVTDEVVHSAASMDGYNLYDLVTFTTGGDSVAAGVIIAIGKRSVQLLDQHGIVHDVSSQQLRGKKNRDR
jgi:hypothetical protein